MDHSQCLEMSRRLLQLMLSVAGVESPEVPEWNSPPFDSSDHPQYDPQCAMSQYAGLVGTGEQKASWRARPDGLKVRK